MPKKVECKPPAWTDEDHIAYAWCINHGITIGALAVAPGWYNAGWLIEITINGKKITSPKEYGKNELWDKVFELYKFYYDQYNKQNYDMEF